MKKLTLSLILTMLATFWLKASANYTHEDKEIIYHSFSYGENPINQNVFNYAFKGFLKLKGQNKLKKDNILTIIDYSLSSSIKRLWVLDMNSNKVLFNELTSHGKYSGGEYANKFSNQVGSKMSSIGFFITGKTYNGKHKFSLKLHGMDTGYNSNAFQRGIVIHGADYVSSDFVYNNHRLGRSYGCPAIRQSVKYDLINTITGGSALFSYYPNSSYLNNSVYLR